MNFCSHCGARVALHIPPGDNVPRYVCDACGTIHYHNPKTRGGLRTRVRGEDRAVPARDRAAARLLDRSGGFMENGETLQQAAARESREEALIDVEIGSLLSVVHVLYAHQVHVFFRGRMRSGSYGAGVESLEVELVHPDAIPWPDLAFPSTEYTLRRYLEDRAAKREAHYFTSSSAAFKADSFTLGRAHGRMAC